MRCGERRIGELTSWRPIKSAMDKSNFDLWMLLNKGIEGQSIGGVSECAGLVVCSDDTYPTCCNPLQECQVTPTLPRSATTGIKILEDFDAVAPRNWGQKFAGLPLHLWAGGSFIVPGPALPDVDNRGRQLLIPIGD